MQENNEENFTIETYIPFICAGVQWLLYASPDFYKLYYYYYSLCSGFGVSVQKDYKTNVKK